MIRETWVQSQVTSYQRLLKWYLIPPCLALSDIRYVLRVKWNILGKGVAASSTARCSSYWKGSLQVALYYSCQLYLLLLIIVIICLHTVIWWEMFLFNTNNFCRCMIFYSSNLIQIIYTELYNLNLLNMFEVLWFQVFLCITNDSLTDL